MISQLVLLRARLSKNDYNSKKSNSTGEQQILQTFEDSTEISKIISPIHFTTHY